MSGNDFFMAENQTLLIGGSNSSIRTYLGYGAGMALRAHAEEHPA